MKSMPDKYAIRMNPEFHILLVLQRVSFVD